MADPVKGKIDSYSSGGTTTGAPKIIEVEQADGSIWYVYEDAPTVWRGNKRVYSPENDPRIDKGAPAPTVRTKADNSTEQWDPIAKAWVSKDAAPAVAPKEPTTVNAPTDQPYIVQRGADGKPAFIKNKNYINPSQQGMTLAEQQKFNWDQAMDAADRAERAGQLSSTERLALLRLEHDRQGQENTATNERERIAIESRNTDISQQNSNISQQNANTSAYGQRLGYAEGMAGQVNNAWNNALPFMAPVGTQAAFNANIGQIGSNNPQMQGLPTGPFPYDPNSMPHVAAATALASISPAAAAAIGASGQQTSFAAPGPGQPVPPESLVK